MKSYLRFLSRNKLYTAIELAGLSVALAFVIVLSSYILNDMSVNRALEDTENIYLVHRAGVYDIFKEVPDLYDEMPEIESFCNFMQSGRNPSLFQELTVASYGDKKMDVKIMGASETFFDFFTFPLSEGDPKNAMLQKNSVVISQELANVLFPDGNAVGKQINVFEKNYMKEGYAARGFQDLNVDLIVTGVYKSFSKSIFIEPHLIMNFELLLEQQNAMFKGGMGHIWCSFVKLRENSDKGKFLESLNAEFRKQPLRYHSSMILEVGMIPFDEIKKQEYNIFSRCFENVRQGRLFGIYLIMCIFIVIVSLLDYIVLTIAFSRFRIKEIATRQLLGTDRRGIMGRCFTEAFLLLAVSCLFAVLLAVAFKNPIGEILGAEINPLSQLDEYLVLSGIILLMVAIASAVPSFTLSSYSAINVIKGEARYRDKVIFGKVFIALAGFLSIVALAVCFGVTRQTRHFINQPLGYEYEDIVCVEFRSDDNRFYDELTTMSYVEKIGAYSSLPMQWTNSYMKHHDSDDVEDIRFIGGNSGYFDILGVDILEDKGNVASSSKNGKWFVCESFVDGVGQCMTDDMLNMYYPVPLGGIVKDVKIGGLKEDVKGEMSFIKVVDTPEMVESGSPIVKVNIDGNEAKRRIADFYRAKGYEDKQFEVFTLCEKMEREIKEEDNMLKLLTGFSVISLLMTIMTIVGLSSYYTKTTEKDNAVRNVFGCSKGELVRNITLEFVLPVLLSAFIAIPVAYVVIGRWLEGYAIRADNSPLIYAGALGVVLFCVVAAILLQTLGMIRTNPAEVLKKE